MYWIVQNNTANEAGWVTLVTTLERFNIPHSVHKIIPFVGELVDPPEIDHTNVICIGSYSLRHYAKKHSYAPGVFDLEPYDFTQQLAHWGDHMLNADSIVTSFEHANPDHEEFFCRPILDSKSFAGVVFSRDEFYEWKRKICVLEHDYGDSVSKHTMIQVAPTKQIYAEYRFFIVDGKISTASMYKQADKVVSLNIDQAGMLELFGFVKSRIAEWNPLGSMCIDIADTHSGFKIIEINTINSSGFYAANVQKLVFDLELAYTNYP